MLDFEICNPEKNELFLGEKYRFLYLLRGSAQILMGKKMLELNAEDFILITPYTPCLFLDSKDTVVLCMNVDAYYIQKATNYTANHIIECCSVNVPDYLIKAIMQTRTLFANLFMMYSREDASSHLRSQGTALLFFDHLFSWFAVDMPRETQFESTGKNVLYMRKTIQYIQQNYNSSPRLKDIAGILGITSNHLSRCLHNGIGYSFMDLVQDYRLRQAVEELKNSRKSITEIAYDNGFSGPSAFINKFKEKYGITPSQSRKVIICEKTTPESKQVVEVDQNIYESITKYISISTEISARKNPIRRCEAVACDVTREGAAVDDYWRRTACINLASDGLTAVVQKQIRMTQKEIGFEFLRFHGILNDDMLIYDEDDTGKPVFNFIYVDELFDFLQDVGLKPYIELSYMPKKLSGTKKKERPISFSNFYA